MDKTETLFYFQLFNLNENEKSQRAFQYKTKSEFDVR